MKIMHHIKKYYGIRKAKDEKLPPWKSSVHDFNEKNLHWIEKFVEFCIPWLVLLLLLILLAEFAEEINIFSWQWLSSLAQLAQNYETYILLLDRIIVTFFVIDLYFSFFKKATLWTFIKHYFLDIIAIFPFGLFIGAEAAAVQETQRALHLVEETEKEAAKLPLAQRVWSSVVRLSGRSARFVRPAAQISRSLRVYRLIDFAKPKEGGRRKHKGKKKMPWKRK